MPAPRNAKSCRRRLAAAAAAYLVATVVSAAHAFASSFYNKQPYHTSALSGHAWVQELIHGHPDRIKNELGMRLPVFEALVLELRTVLGLGNSRHITLEEHLAIFLYTCVTGLSLRHVGERFQHATATISRSFCMILNALSSAPFYQKYVHPPTIDDPVPPEILNNPKSAEALLS